MDSLCAACGDRLSGPVMVRVGPARLVNCDRCASWTYLPRVRPEEQAAIHDNREYFDHPYFQGRRDTRLIDQRCREIFGRIGRGLDLVTLRGEGVLDVGCDTGAFIESAARQFGIVPAGLDVAARAVEVARSIGVDAYHADLAAAPAHLTGLRLITAIDLIEHIIDPGPFLDGVRQRLTAGGCCYLETPNIRSLVYRLGAGLGRCTGARPRPAFERLFPSQHVQYFTPESLATLARGHGFEVAWLGLRVLPPRDLVAVLPVRLGLMAVQALDALLGRQILICVLLRKGAS